MLVRVQSDIVLSAFIISIFCPCTLFCSFPNGASGYCKTFSTGPCSHNWVRDDLHGGGKLFRSDGGEHSGSLHGENKHARYRDSYFDANRVGTERSQRHDDQNQFGLIESNGTNCAGTTVSVEDSTSSQHQITGAYGRGEAQREHGRRGTQRMSDDGEIRRDNAASPENNSKTLHRYVMVCDTRVVHCLFLTVIHHSTWR